MATLLTIRRPFGILGMIAAVAGTATVWGIIQFSLPSTQSQHVERALGEAHRGTQGVRGAPRGSSCSRSASSGRVRIMPFCRARLSSRCRSAAARRHHPRKAL
ncbi:MAG: hypothetical protein ACLTSX_13765 [Collinsella sp.]